MANQRNAAQGVHGPTRSLAAGEAKENPRENTRRAHRTQDMPPARRYRRQHEASPPAICRRLSSPRPGGLGWSQDLRHPDDQAFQHDAGALLLRTCPLGREFGIQHPAKQLGGPLPAKLQ